MTDIEGTDLRQTTDHERRDGRQSGNRLLGRVVACSGSRAVVSAIARPGDTSVSELWSVGRLISIKVGDGRVVALVYAMHTGEKTWSEATDNSMNFEVELVGEIRSGTDGRSRFSAGISHYPYLGAIAHRLRSDDLRAIYDTGQTETAVIGTLTQDETMEAAIHVPSMLQRHFAVVGTTGVGKSTAVALLLRKAIESDPNLRVMILDPHNEFAAAFPDTAVVVDTEGLDLPFWLFRLEEFVAVIFRGRPGVPEEIDTLRDLIPEAKRGFRGSADNALFRRATDKSSLTADTPVPYRVADLLALIDERIGRLEGRNEKPHLRSLKNRITSVINDPRFHFMFSTNTINDTITETISHLFRIPGDGRPVTAFQLSGIPSEVVDSVASVICRMAFEICLWSAGAVRILVVCEEAHRYVPADPNLGFVPTRQAIARIAKEGRKYGACLGVVTQRPGELDPTILSQCSTVFAMRLANDLDQDIIRSAIPDSSTSTTSFLSSMGNGEAIAFGEAISVPMRMRFSRVPADRLPKANSSLVAQTEKIENFDLRAIVQRMRTISGQEAGPSPTAPQPGDDIYRSATAASPHGLQSASETRAASLSATPRLRRHDDHPDAGSAPGHRAHPEAGTQRTDDANPAREQALSRLDLLREQSSSLRRDPAIRASLLKKPIGSLLK